MTDVEPSLAAQEIARIAARIDRPIALVGLMGVGKSTVGRNLANLISRKFVDADDAIEAAARLSISEIFEEFGEAYFRDGERRVIARLLDQHSGVIATGGGAFVDEETRALILDKAIAVWIDCDIDTLVERTSRRDTRPLLKSGDPRTILTQLYTDREPFYSQSQVRVLSRDGPHVETAVTILEAIDAWL
ncbi:MAG: shikimate kinase [Erythrobacter sp.]